jgi:hypothetical protein
MKRNGKNLSDKTIPGSHPEKDLYEGWLEDTFSLSSVDSRSLFLGRRIVRLPGQWPDRLVSWQVCRAFQWLKGFLNPIDNKHGIPAPPFSAPFRREFIDGSPSADASPQ